MRCPPSLVRLKMLMGNLVSVSKGQLWTEIASCAPRHRFAFIRMAGIVQTWSVVLISSHVANRTSPDRAAVSIKNWRTPASSQPRPLWSRHT